MSDLLNAVLEKYLTIFCHYFSEELYLFLYVKQYTLNENIFANIVPLGFWNIPKMGKYYEHYNKREVSLDNLINTLYFVE